MEEWKTDKFLKEHGLIFNKLPYEIRNSIQSLKQQYGKVKKIVDRDAFEERMVTLRERDEAIVYALELYLGQDEVLVDDNEEVISSNEIEDLIKENGGAIETPKDEPIDEPKNEPAPAPRPNVPPSVPPQKPNTPKPTPSPEPIVNELVLDDNDKILIGMLKEGKRKATWKELHGLGFTGDLLTARGGRTKNFELNKGRFDMEYLIIPSDEVKHKYLQNG